MDSIRKINNEHDEAMEHAHIADRLMKKGNSPAAMESYTTAYAMERGCAEAVDKLDATVTKEPTRSILYVGAMSLAVLAGLENEAKELANKILSFTKYSEYIDEANKVLKDYEN